MLNKTKNITALLAAGFLAVSLAACSTPEPAPSTSEPAPSQSQEETPTPLASIPSLAGVDTQVAVDADFLAAITSLGVTPGVLGGATLTDGVLAFPITGGNVDYYDPAEDYRPYVQGVINHDGSGFSLAAGGTTVELANFVIDPGNNSNLMGDVSVNGSVVAEDVKLFDLDGTTLQPLQTDANGNAVLEGTRVLLSEDAAGLLNDTFGIEDLQSQMLIGIAKITVATPAA